MSGARDALHALADAAAPLLVDAAAAHPLRKQAADIADAADFIVAAERVIPLILDIEGAADALTAHAKRLRETLATVMDETGAATIRSPLHTASVSRGRAAVVITDSALIPPEFMRVPPPAPDKAAISKSLKEGVAIPGALLGNAAPQLTIRRRDTE